MTFIGCEHIAQLLIQITHFIYLYERNLSEDAKKTAMKINEDLKNMYSCSAQQEKGMMYTAYPHLDEQDKLCCLVQQGDLDRITRSLPSCPKTLFEPILENLILVIKSCYLNEFLKSEVGKLNGHHHDRLPRLGYNSNGDSIADLRGRSGERRHTNIFVAFSSNRALLKEVF